MSSQPLLQSAPGKRIALPTRVEPKVLSPFSLDFGPQITDSWGLKVFFANERTFLSWLNFTVILGGLAVGLLNFGDRVGRISAGLFTFVAMGTMLYALVTFHWRAAAIRKRGQGSFDDRFGPTVLVRFFASCSFFTHQLFVRQGFPAHKTNRVGDHAFMRCRCQLYSSSLYLN